MPLGEKQPYCVICKEDFPVVADARHSSWRMGEMRPLSYAPKRLRQKHSTEWEHVDYLCGNCYFDYLDATEEAS